MLFSKYPLGPLREQLIRKLLANHICLLRLTALATAHDF
jgi:hypothetical protein